MSKPESGPSTAFLNEVRRQLRTLELPEQREILEELTHHLQDAVARHESVGLSPAAAEAAAVRAMGDPVAIGRQLRDEHLNQRLSLFGALLCALPLAAIALIFSRTDLYFMVRNFAGPNSGFPFSFLLALTPVIALSLGLLARTRQIWPATLLGGVGVLFLLGLAHGLRISQHPALAFAGIGVLVLAIIPLTLAVTLRWGTLRATLGLLGSVGVYGCYAWLETAGPIATLAFSLCPILGVMVLGLVSRRRQWSLAWAVFALNWALILFYSLHVVREQAVPGPTPGTFDVVSAAFLVASAALLLAMQAVTHLQTSGRLTLVERWVLDR